MGKTNYDLIWKNGSFFEKGHWKLVPKKVDSGGEILGYLFAVGLVVFILFCLILTLPLWVSLLGFSMLKSKRYYAGVGSIVALLYFLLDIQKKWVSGFLLFGYKSSGGGFNEGLFGEKYAIYFYIVNCIGVLIGLSFIIESCLIDEGNSNNTARESNDFQNTKQQPIVEIKEVKQTNDVEIKYYKIFGILILTVSVWLYIQSQSNNRKGIQTKAQVTQDSTVLGQTDALLVGENNKYKIKAYQDSISNLNNYNNDSISLSQQIVDTTDIVESNNNIQNSSEISNSFFYGNWKDENTTITFFNNGKCLMKFSRYEVTYNWNYQNGYLYIGSDKNNLTKHDFLLGDSNSFSYKAENENIKYNAHRIE